MARNYRYENFTGGLNNVSSIGTINQSPKRTESPDMANVEYFKLGGLKSMEGNIQIGDTQESSVIGGWEYTKGNNKYLLTVNEDGELRILNTITNTFDLIYTFAGDTNRASFVNFNNGVVVTNGVDDLVFYEKGRNTSLSGTVTTTIGSKNVVGVSTHFGTDVVVGDQVLIGSNLYFVETITSPTHLTLSKNATASLVGVAYSLGELSLCNATLINTDDPTVSIPIRGLALNTWNGRLFVGSGGTLYYAELGRVNGWDIKYGAGGIPNSYNDSSNVKALGLYSNYMLIHKEFYTYILTGGTDPSEWQVSPYSSISCDSQQSSVVTNSVYYVFSKENMGIYPLTQITVFSDKYVGPEISTKIRDYFSNVILSDTEKIFAVRYPKKRRMMMYLPTINASGSSVAVVYDFQTKTWLMRKVPQEVTIAFEYANDAYIGTADGKVLREFAGTTFDGQFIDAYWKSPWLDMGDDSYYKSFSEFNIQLAEDFTNSFVIRTRRDGNSNYKEREFSSDTPDVNALIWEGTSESPNNLTYWDYNDWVKSGFLTIRCPLENQFFQCYQLEIATKTLGQGFYIYGFDIRRVELEEAPY